jgi:ribose/xylose/arabinose/galactoside ABC-type transport system permease subunit
MRALLARHALWLLIALLVAVGALVSPTFLEPRNLKNVLISLSSIGVLALGQTPVMLMRRVDLSGGSAMAFAPIAAIAIAGLLIDSDDVAVIEGGNYVVTGLHVVIGATLVIATGIGVVNGALVVFARVPSLIATLGMLYVLRGLSYIVSNGRPLYMTRLEGFSTLGNFEFGGVLPASFCVFLLLGLALAALFRFTRVGWRVYATGNNERAAVYSGIATGAGVSAAFAFAGLCAGIAALIHSSRLESVEAAQAMGYELMAIAVAVIGGTTLQGGRGSVIGTVLAAIVLGLVMNILALAGVVVWYQTIIVGLVIVCAIFLYDRGGSGGGSVRRVPARAGA